ncbi:J domain-containing protein [Sansalvadorimonas verongulae]|uniref:J domain-containing protein n=1 Tax=Sansalvadorimonas verongulae TaxID=2172824 RepID=UPI0012BC64C3|nr:J domain-containing protein [Sansalvadorimonas verongulae]MTI13039.1 J domain-containing protein [Sansalvadorimonas verongulae]
MRIRSLLKPILIAPLLWGASSFSAAEAGFSVGQEGRNPVETTADSAQRNSFISAIPVFSSDQGMVVQMGSRIVVLEGLNSSSWWWLVSQMGLQAVSQIILNAISIQYHNNENNFSDSNLGFAGQSLAFGFLPIISTVLFVRNILKNYHEAGLWAVFADISATNLLVGYQRGAFTMASLSALSAMASHVQYYRSGAEYGQQRVYLDGLEAANLLIQIDYDNSSFGYTRMTFSRIQGTPIKDRSHSEFSALSYAMDQAGVSSVNIETVSPYMGNDGYFVLSYKEASGESRTVRFNMGGKSKPWLIDLVHSKSKKSKLVNSRSALSPAAINIITRWLELSEGDETAFPLGTVSLSIDSQTQQTAIVSVYESASLEDVKVEDDSSLTLGGKYSLSLADGYFLSTKVLTIPTEQDKQYTQYRVPKWFNHFMLTQATKATKPVVIKGANFAMEKMYSDGWKMSDLNQLFLGRVFKGGIFQERIADRLVHRSELEKAQQVLIDNYPADKPLENVQGLLSDDNTERLVKAFRQISKIHHPDKFSGQEQSVIEKASETFKNISRANDMLGWFLSHKGEILVVDKNSSPFQMWLYQKMERATRKM